MGVKELLEEGRDAFIAVEHWYRGPQGEDAPSGESHGCMVTLLPWGEHGDSFSPRMRAMEVLYATARERHPERCQLRPATASTGVQRFNDDPRTSKEEADEVYREAVRRVS